MVIEMMETGNPKVDRILNKLSDAEVELITKYLTTRILSILIEKSGIDAASQNPLSI